MRRAARFVGDLGRGLYGFSRGSGQSDFPRLATTPASWSMARLALGEVAPGEIAEVLARPLPQLLERREPDDGVGVAQPVDQCRDDHVVGQFRPEPRRPRADDRRRVGQSPGSSSGRCRTRARSSGPGSAIASQAPRRGAVRVRFGETNRKIILRAFQRANVLVWSRPGRIASNPNRCRPDGNGNPRIRAVGAGPRRRRDGSR